MKKRSPDEVVVSRAELITTLEVLGIIKALIEDIRHVSTAKFDDLYLVKLFAITLINVTIAMNWIKDQLK